VATWGSTTVYVRPEPQYQPGYVAPNITEIAILGDPAALNTAASVIQGNGRGRKTIAFEAHVAAIADYDTLFTDLVNQEIRTWTGPDGGTLSAVIVELTPAFWQDNHIRFSMRLVEAV
jgi:hypothetical protein